MQDLVLSLCDCYSAIWSSAAKNKLEYRQLVQNRIEQLAHYCLVKASGPVDKMHADLTQLKAEHRYSLFIKK